MSKVDIVEHFVNGHPGQSFSEKVTEHTPIVVRYAEATLWRCHGCDCFFSMEDELDGDWLCPSCRPIKNEK